MNMQEMSRLIEGLREIGLKGEELADFLLWIESGDRTKLQRAKGSRGARED
ncbi:MAG: hypothetical protein IJ849_01745 [Selenomonadaceae bacterium]|nr:hypothetical protein [Selenomonadaceae bacterium]